jgi:hypothetical protein
VTGRDRGQATPLVAAVVVFAAIVAFALVRAGRVAVDSARARGRRAPEDRGRITPP